MSYKSKRTLKAWGTGSFGTAQQLIYPSSSPKTAKLAIQSDLKPYT